MNYSIENKDLFKRAHGQYFTQRNPFNHSEFLKWAARADLPTAVVVEPFAGANSIVKMLIEQELCEQFQSFDIEPADESVLRWDTIASYPASDGVAITNPPYLAKNSAKRRGLAFPVTEYGDLYLLSLDLMLKHHDYIAAIVPAALGTTDHFRDRLTHLIYLPFSDMFGETDHPVCLALFEPASSKVSIWSWMDYLGDEKDLASFIPQPGFTAAVKFNVANGLLGLFSVDGTLGPSIRFCRGQEIPSSAVKPTSRSRTRLEVEGITEDNLDGIIGRLNTDLNAFRAATRDTTMTPFKGLRKDGQFRRRLDFKTAKALLNAVMTDLQRK